MSSSLLVKPNPILNIEPLSSELRTLRGLCSKDVFKKIKLQKSNDLPPQVQARILSQIQRVADSLVLVKDLEGTLSSRVNFLGHSLAKTLENFNSIDKTSPFSHKLALMLIKLSQLKNSLHIEAIIFSRCYFVIKAARDFHHEVHEKMEDSIDELSPEFIGSLGTLYHNMQYDIPEKCFSINISKIINVLDEKDVGSMSEQFDLVMFQVLSKYKLVDGFLKIPFDNLPLKEMTSPLAKSPDENVRLLGQLLTFCRQNVYITLAFAYNPLAADHLFSQMEIIEKGPDADGKVEYVLNNFLKDKDLVPNLCKLLEIRNTFMTRYKHFAEIVRSEEDCDKLFRDIPEPFEEDASNLYEVILQIENLLMLFLTKDHINRFKNILEPTTCSKIISEFNQQLHKNYRDRGKTWPYPIPEAESFCQDKKGLESLYEVSSDLWKRDRSSTPLKEIISQTISNRSLAKPKKAKIPPCKRTETPHDTTSSADEETKAEREEELLAEPVVAQAYDKPYTELGEKLYKLHPRVSSWMNSAEEGLISHHYDTTHILPQHEMILRHRFPMSILPFLFDDSFSKHSLWQEREGYDHFESLLLINKKKYILEATLNPEGVIFHLYARPVKSFTDYYSMVYLSPTEFPTLTRSYDAVRECKEDASILFESGNVIIPFEGSSYEVIRLKDPSEE